MPSSLYPVPALILRMQSRSPAYRWRQILNSKQTFKTLSMKRRGALIVFEGCDRCGKTTQCFKITEKLSEDGLSAKLLKFPDRTTSIGVMIDGYLGRKVEFEDHAVHLLFSANRWECVPAMKRLLESGTTLIIDRYAFSGVAFTAAKKGFTIDWCKQPDVGLPRPDKVLYLTLSAEAAAKRGGFGEERYEKEEMQKKVADNFEKLKDESWQWIDADKSVEDLHRELYNIVTNTIEEVKNKPLELLWTHDHQ